MRSINRRMMMAASSVLVLAPRAMAQGAAPAAKLPDTDWLHYGGDLASTRYSPLDQISAANFNKLEVAWRFNTNALGPTPDAYFNSTPLIVKGRIFTTAGMRRDVVALDAATGELLWFYRHDEGQRLGTRGGPGFGCAYWTDGTQERVLFCTRGYTMISLDAKTGLPDPNFGDKGLLDLRLNNDQEIDPNRGVIGIHAPPLVVKNTVVVGAAPSAAVKGYLRGFDVKTGQRKWIFHTIPRKGEFGYDTWTTPGQAEAAGNMGVWAPMSADEELGLVYAGVELPPTDMNGTTRHGNALFAESVVALDIETGKRKWHYQLTHHGLWDHDIPCAAILCDIPVNGRMVKALAQPSKQGFLYVLNRETGKPIWPIPERPAPKGDVPGEWYSPTQPVPSKPPPYDVQGVSENDLIDWTPELKARAVAISKHYKLGPLFTPPPVVKADQGMFGMMLLPGTQGGANWPGGSYDPESRMVYVYSKTRMEAAGINVAADGRVSQAGLTTTPNTADPQGGIFGGNASLTGGSERTFVTVNDAIDAPIVPRLLSIEGLPLNKPPFGRITAIDLNKGAIAWQVAHGETPDFIRNHPRLKGVKIPRTGQSGILGTLTTKTLVICGDAGVFTDEQGRKAARLRAYDKATGEEKGAVLMDKVQTGSPITYMQGGRQYIVVPTGSGYGSELVAYRLPA
ncbi:MAG TPA: PQQ-binding-like beta-propeller repeat protein [Rhizomicrobium sp.]|nr:PQQ-binding-like beta-propeller repeat protein [Rhizomicrobium sp.]